MRCYILIVFFILYTTFSGLAQETARSDNQLSTEDSIAYQHLKQQMARHVNPNPDSSLYYVLKLKEFSSQRNYEIGLADGDYLHASYLRRIQKFDSSILYFQKALHKATKINYLRGMAVANNGLCRTYYRVGQLENALNSCKECLIVAEELLDIAIISDTHIAFGNIYIRQNDLKQALKSLLKVDSLHSIQPLRIDIIAAAYQGLGSVYQELADYGKSEEYFLKANDEFKKMPVDASYYLNTTNWHLGEVYYHQGALAKADSLLQETYEFFTLINDGSTMAQISIYLGLIRQQNNQLEEAEQFLANGFQLHKENGNAYETSIAALELGKLYINKNQSQKAIEYLNEALTKNSDKDNSLTIQESLLKLAEAYDLQNNHSQAYQTLRRGMDLKDSLNKVQNTATIREIEAIYQSEKQEQEIELLTTQKELVEQQNTNLRNLFMGGGAVLALALVGLFLLYRNKQRTNDRLKELDAMKSNFFANISHEFRTPLTLISGPIQQKLADDQLPRKDRAEFERINRSSHRLLELVDQLLDLSKIEAGSLKLQVENGDVLSYLRAIADPFTFAAKQKEIQYHLNIETKENDSWFDKDAVEKILVNLLSNAIKYTPAEGLVELNATVADHQLSIEVKNTGKGLTQKQLSKVFERFYQTDDYQAGSGVGLALLKELVSLHKGEVSVKSKPNGWTSFLVTLPINQTAYQEDQLRKLPVSDTRNAVVSNQVSELDEVGQNPDEQPILLVVEDNPDVMAMLCNTFENKYNVITAGDGDEGVMLAIDQVPDLIISDVMMPVKDGIALTEELKIDERTSHIPIILLTAKAGEENELLGIETGADDYMTKPFNHKILVSKVAKLIELRKKLQSRYSQEVILKPKDIAITSVDEQFLERVQSILDKKLLESSFNTEHFSQGVGMSRMQLHRKLKALTGLSATEFIRSQRLKLAAKLLKKSDTNVSQVGYAVGFNDHSYFSRCFKEAYLCTPSEYSDQG